MQTLPFLIHLSGPLASLNLFLSRDWVSSQLAKLRNSNSLFGRLQASVSRWGPIVPPEMETPSDSCLALSHYTSLLDRHSYTIVSPTRQSQTLCYDFRTSARTSPLRMRRPFPP